MLIDGGRCWFSSGTGAVAAGSPALFLVNEALGEIAREPCRPSSPAPGLVDFLKEACAVGFCLVLVRNTPLGGIADQVAVRSHWARVASENLALIGRLSCAGIEVGASIACGEAWGEHSAIHRWRLPGDGMIQIAAARLDLDLSRSWLISRDPEHRSAAQALRGLVLLADAPAPHSCSDGRLICIETLGEKGLAARLAAAGLEGRGLSALPLVDDTIHPMPSSSAPRN